MEDNKGMSGKKNMKTKFIKISRILLIIFAVLLAILIGYVMFTEKQEFSLPPVLGILVLAAVVLVIACLLAAWVLDLIDNYKRGGVPYLISYVVVIAVFGLVLAGFDFFLGGEDVELINTVIRAVAVVCGIRAGSYIFSK